jgi:hypothetical protein
MGDAIGIAQASVSRRMLEGLAYPPQSLDPPPASGKR